MDVYDGHYSAHEDDQNLSLLFACSLTGLPRLLQSLICGKDGTKASKG